MRGFGLSLTALSSTSQRREKRYVTEVNVQIQAGLLLRPHHYGQGLPYEDPARPNLHAPWRSLSPL